MTKLSEMPPEKLFKAVTCQMGEAPPEDPLILERMLLLRYLEANSEERPKAWAPIPTLLKMVRACGK